MAISGVTNDPAVKAQTSAATTEAGSKNALDYQAFLQLLLAQLKNQDPTQPMDSTQYMAQLAAFSNVEQGIKTNAKLDSLMQSQYLNQADSVIGRNVTTADGTVSGKVVSVGIFSDGVIANLENGKKVLLGPGIVIT